MPDPRHYTPEEEVVLLEKIKQYDTEGKSRKQLERDLGMSRNSLQWFAKTRGVEHGVIRAKMKPGAEADPIRVAIVKRMQELDIGTPALSEMCGGTPTIDTIYRYIIGERYATSVTLGRMLDALGLGVIGIREPRRRNDAKT